MEGALVLSCCLVLLPPVLHNVLWNEEAADTERDTMSVTAHSDILFCRTCCCVA